MLVDPPFEEPGEFERLRHGLAKAHARWPTGTYLLWYPLKDVAAAEAFGGQLARAGIPDILRAELRVGPIRADGPLNGCGMVVVNPPYTLERDLETLLPALAERLGQDRSGARRRPLPARPAGGGGRSAGRAGKSAGPGSEGIQETASTAASARHGARPSRRHRRASPGDLDRTIANGKGNEGGRRVPGTIGIAGTSPAMTGIVATKASWPEAADRAG